MVANVWTARALMGAPEEAGTRPVPIAQKPYYMNLPEARFGVVIGWA